MSKSKVLVIGGDGRPGPATHLDVHFTPSSKYGGSRRIAHAVAAIRSGSVHTVILLARWIGHSDMEVVVRACRSANVRVIVTHRAVRAAIRSLGGSP